MRSIYRSESGGHAGAVEDSHHGVPHDHNLNCGEIPFLRSMSSIKLRAMMNRKNIKLDMLYYQNNLGQGLCQTQVWLKVEYRLCWNEHLILTNVQECSAPSIRMELSVSSIQAGMECSSSIPAGMKWLQSIPAEMECHSTWNLKKNAPPQHSAGIAKLSQSPS